MKVKRGDRIALLPSPTFNRAELHQGHGCPVQPDGKLPYRKYDRPIVAGNSWHRPARSPRRRRPTSDSQPVRTVPAFLFAALRRHTITRLIFALSNRAAGNEKIIAVYIPEFDKANSRYWGIRSRAAMAVSPNAAKVPRSHSGTAGTFHTTGAHAVVR